MRLGDPKNELCHFLGSPPLLAAWMVVQWLVSVVTLEVELHIYSNL
jgi:hypothetical protein